MSNKITDLLDFYNGDKILSPVVVRDLADKFGLSSNEIYLLQKKSMINKLRNTTEEKINVDTDRITKDIVKEINKAFKK